jgi:flagellar biosynthesis protein FlhG
MDQAGTTRKIISVGGGKGGVGKSLLCCALGSALVRAGHRVILVDLDLGAANLHTYLGIRGANPTIADFIRNKVSSLDQLVVETSVQGLGLICGAGFVPGATNPAHWMKLKLMRHLKALDADFVIIDLGAGVQFNTLDFFGISGWGVVITSPDPGAVLNAYSFIKGALFRKMQNVFRSNPAVAAMITAGIKQDEGDGNFSVDWFRKTLQSSAPELLPLIDEVAQSFSPGLVINRAPHGRTHVLVKNLLTLCHERLGVRLNHLGDLPEVRELPNHLLHVTRFFTLPAGQAFYGATGKIVSRLTTANRGDDQSAAPLHDYSEEERDELMQFIDTLDDRVFNGANRNPWKVRMFFNPADVVSFLVSRGVSHSLFEKSA